MTSSLAELAEDDLIGEYFIGLEDYTEEVHNDIMSMGLFRVYSHAGHTSIKSDMANFVSSIITPDIIKKKYNRTSNALLRNIRTKRKGPMNVVRADSGEEIIITHVQADGAKRRKDNGAISDDNMLIDICYFLTYYKRTYYELIKYLAKRGIKANGVTIYYYKRVGPYPDDDDNSSETGEYAEIKSLKIPLYLYYAMPKKRLKREGDILID